MRRRRRPVDREVNDHGHSRTIPRTSPKLAYFPPCSPDRPERLNSPAADSPGLYDYSASSLPSRSFSQLIQPATPIRIWDGLSRLSGGEKRMCKVLSRARNGGRRLCDVADTSFAKHRRPRPSLDMALSLQASRFPKNRHQPTMTKR